MPELDPHDAEQEICSWIRDIRQYYQQMGESEQGSRKWRARLFDLASAAQGLAKVATDLSDQMPVEAGR